MYVGMKTISYKTADPIWLPFYSSFSFVGVRFWAKYDLYMGSCFSKNSDKLIKDIVTNIKKTSLKYGTKLSYII